MFRSIKSSRTIHAFSELSRSRIQKQLSKRFVRCFGFKFNFLFSHSFTNEMAIDESEETRADESNKCNHLSRNTMILLVNDTNPTIATIQELGTQTKYTPGETPEDDVIFL